MTIRRLAIWCVGGLIALLGLVALGVALLVYRPRLLQPLVERALAPRGGTAVLADLSVTLRPPGLAVSGLSISSPADEGELLRIERLRAELIPFQFVRGGPWLRHVEVKGLVFERAKQRQAKGPPDLTPLTRLFELEDLSISDARVRMAFPEGEMEAQSLHLTLTPGTSGARGFAGDGEFTFRHDGSIVASGRIAARGHVIAGLAIEARLDLAQARLSLPQLAGDLFGTTTLRITRDRLAAEKVSLILPQARFRPTVGTEQNVGAVRLEAAGTATLDFRETSLEVKRLEIGDILRAQGRLRGATVEELSGTLEGEIPRTELLKAVAAPLLPSGSKRVDVAGALPFRVVLSPGGNERLLAIVLLPRDLAVSWPQDGLRCRFGGNLRAASTLSGWRDRKTNVTWQLSSPAGRVTRNGRVLPLGTLAVRGSAEVSSDSFRAERIEVRSDTLGSLTGRVAFREGGFAGSLTGSRLPAAALMSLVGAATGRNVSGWAPAGTVDVAARVDPAEGGSRATASVTLERIGFSSPAGGEMSQNLSGRIDLAARLAREPRVTADLSIKRGEALWGTIYLNLADAPFDLHAGVTRAGPGKYKDIALDAVLAGFGRVHVEGTARQAGAGGGFRHQGRLVLKDAQLGTLFRTFLRDPLAVSRPDLSGLQVNGTAAMEISFAGSGKNADLAGRLRLRDVGLFRQGVPPIFSGLDLDLPIAYALGVPDPGRPRPTEKAVWGRLAFHELRLAGQELGPLALPVVLVPNRLYLRGSLSASLFGAKLVLRRIQVQEPLSQNFHFEFSARLSDLDLARLGGAKPMLSGRVGGLLDPVRIGEERLTAGGELSGDLFGGRLAVRNITVDRPFSPGREIGADVTVDRLDLERLSEGLGVGRITGRLSGSLQGLRVAYGQPVAFELRMRSVPTKGVPQEVSLKAVNSISLVSTGSTLSGLGSSLMTTFFRQFPYDKIGIECGLKNDVFTVRGLIHEDGVEYLVKRGFFGGINVVNRNPDNRIGFSDMLERARRVTSEHPQ